MGYVEPAAEVTLRQEERKNKPASLIFCLKNVLKEVLCACMAALKIRMMRWRGRVFWRIEEKASFLVHSDQSWLLFVEKGKGIEIGYQIRKNGLQLYSTANDESKI